jgi:enterochelin esterase-like enzyme
MRSLGNYGAFEKDLIEDVLPYVQNRYRVRKDRQGRAIAGLSMGGGQALTVGLGNPGVFGWLGAFSSAVPRGRKLDTLLAEPEAINDRLELLWVGCGRKDFLFQSNRKLIDRLKADNIEHIARITEGAHEWRLWRRYLSEFVPLLFKTRK